MTPQRAPTQDDLNRKLIDALENNKVDTALALVNAGADPNTRYGLTHGASSQLLNNQPLDPSFLPENSPTAFILACGADCYLSDDADDESDTPICVSEYLPLIQTMLAHGANILSRGFYDYTALHMAVASDRLETVEILLQHGADINAQTSLGQTPLILAAFNPTPEMVHLLLSQGANPNIQDKYGNCALHYAIGNREAASIISELLAHGADPNLLNKQGQTPLRLAKLNNQFDLVELLKCGGRAVGRTLNPDPSPNSGSRGTDG